MKFKKNADPVSINQTYDIGYYARKWKVSVIQIGEAIRETGSNRIKMIKGYLKQHELI